MRIEHNSRNDFYRSPFGAVTTGTDIRIRLAVDGCGIPKSINFIYHDNDREKHSLSMSYVMKIGDFCIYEVIFTPKKCGNVWYYFEITGENAYLCYGNNDLQLGGIGKVYNNEPDKCYQITVYSPRYTTPLWWRNSVCYQIFPDRFFNGNENNEFSGERTDIIKRNWGDTPFYMPSQFGGEYLANDFFGGNLKGIQKKLEYLKDLGISSLYINPIFKSYSNHRYDTGDYMMIDETLGTEEDFINLCKKADELGIKIILDGVFNHTGSDSKYFNKNGNYDSLGAYQSQSSPYYDWYSFEHWNDKYESWWGMLTLPQVNESSPSYQEYILKNDDSVIKHWLKDGASGWRLDVVDELPGFFVKELRKEVKKQNPDAVIIGEVWEDASNKVSYSEEREYFLGEELDSVMNYPLRDALIMLSLGKINAEAFDDRIMSLKENYPRPAFYSLLNMLSSHDMERILTTLSNAPDRRTVSKEWQSSYSPDESTRKKAFERTKQAVIFQMLLPGVPCVYYGDEAGLEGYGDPFCRNTYPWGCENQEMLSWYKNAIALRNKYSAYKDGEFETIYKLDLGYGFIRYNEKEKHIVISNFSDEHKCFRVDLARFGITSLNGELWEENYQAYNGIFYFEMPPRSVKILNEG